MGGTTQIAGGVVEGLKSQPMALALVVINVMFLVAGVWALSRIGDAMKSRDAIIVQMMKDCGARP